MALLKITTLGQITSGSCATFAPSDSQGIQIYSYLPHHCLFYVFLIFKHAGSLENGC